MTIELKLLALVLMLASVFGWGEYRHSKGFQKGVDETTLSYNHKLDEQKNEAATLLAAETRKVKDLEAEKLATKEKQDVEDALHAKKITKLSDELRRAVGPTGRLYDPNAEAPRCGPSRLDTEGEVTITSGSSADDTPKTGGLLSTGVTELLQRLTREADEINLAYRSCRSDAYNIRGASMPTL